MKSVQSGHLPLGEEMTVPVCLMWWLSNSVSAGSGLHNSLLEMKQKKNFGIWCCHGPYHGETGSEAWI